MSVISQAKSTLKRIQSYAFPNVIWKQGVRAGFQNAVRVEIHSNGTDRDIALWIQNGSSEHQSRVMLTSDEAREVAGCLTVASKPARDEMLRKGFRQ